MWRVWVISLAMVVPVSAARAVPITYAFSGTITKVTDETASGAVKVGDSFSGHFTFESTTPDLFPADPDTGWYVQPNPLGPSGLSVAIGSSFTHTLEPDADFLDSTQHISDPTDDLVSIQWDDSTASNALYPTVSFIQGDIDLRAPDGTLHDDSLVTNLVLGDYTIDRDFHLEGLRPEGSPGTFLTVFLFTGTIETLTQVPEPSVAGLVLASLPMLTVVIRRGRRTADTARRTTAAARPELPPRRAR